MQIKFSAFAFFKLAHKLERFQRGGGLSDIRWTLKTDLYNFVFLVFSVLETLFMHFTWGRNSIKVWYLKIKRLDSDRQRPYNIGFIRIGHYLCSLPYPRCSYPTHVGDSILDRTPSIESSSVLRIDDKGHPIFRQTLGYQCIIFDFVFNACAAWHNKAKIETLDSLLEKQLLYAIYNWW